MKCLNCGKEFKITNKHGKKKKYCSQQCNFQFNHYRRHPDREKRERAQYSIHEKDLNLTECPDCHKMSYNRVNESLGVCLNGHCRMPSLLCNGVLHSVNQGSETSEEYHVWRP